MCSLESCHRCRGCQVFPLSSSGVGLLCLTVLVLLGGQRVCKAEGFHYDYNASPIHLQITPPEGDRSGLYIDRTVNLCDDPVGSWDDLKLRCGGTYVPTMWGMESWVNHVAVIGDAAWADVAQSGLYPACLTQGTSIGPGNTFMPSGTMAYELRTNFGQNQATGHWEGKTGYLGIRAVGNGKTYYGWMKCQVPNFLIRSPWMRVYGWGIFSEDMGLVTAGTVPAAGSGVTSQASASFDVGSQVSDMFDVANPGTAGSITVIAEPGNAANGVLQLSHPDGSEPVSVSRTCSAEFLFELDFRYKFDTDGKLEIFLGGMLLDTLVAPASGPGRDSFDTFAGSYNLASFGLAPGEMPLQLRLTNPDDPVFYLDDMMIATRAPEPVSLILLALGAAFLPRRRK